MQDMHTVEPVKLAWMQFTVVFPQLFPKGKREPFILKAVQKKVWARLVSGQLPSLLASHKFLTGTRRLDDEEMEFVESIVIRELCQEEPSWLNYGQDEGTVKLKMEDGILNSLIYKTANIMDTIYRNNIGLGYNSPT